jgi:hypothetical protein
LYLEFDIPRMGRRIDAVVLSRPVIFGRISTISALYQ